MARIRKWYREHRFLLLVVLGIAAVLSVVFGLWALWSLSQSFVNPDTVAEKTAFIQMVVGVVGGVTGIVGGLVLVVGLLLNFRGQNQTQRTALEQIELTRRGQVTERFTKAVEQLGEDQKRDVRLGGIYALRQISEHQAEIGEQAETHARHVEILQILTSYVRERATYEPERTLPRPDYDIEAVLQTIKELRERYKPWQDKLRLQLSYADLLGIEISGIHLEGAILQATYLEGANLHNAFLESASLQGAHLENADISGAHLEFADLRGAHLEGANLSKANLVGAELDGADLEATNLQGTVLEGNLADNIREDLIAYWKAIAPEVFSEEDAAALRMPYSATLQPEQIKQAIGDDETVLPSGVERPKWWKKVLQPSSTEPLTAGDYSIIIGKSLMSFTLDDGWYADLDYLPYYFSLSRTKVGAAGPLLSFAHVESVLDPEKLERLEPEKYREAIQRKIPDIVWFRRHSCLEPLDSKAHQDRVGDPALPGALLEYTVIPDKVKDIPGYRRPCIPLFSLGRKGEFAVFEEDKICVIVLNVEGKSLITQVGSPEDRYDAFLEDATETLKSVKWPAPEQPEGEAPED